MNLAIPVFYLGRDENNFKNAGEFIPERFDVEQTMETLNAFAQIPFSAGPRNCVGQKFAMLEMKNCIISILRKFEIAMDADSSGVPKLRAELVMMPDSDLYFNVKRRC